MAALHLENITKRFARPAVRALDRFSLEVRDGELMVLLGPSGCGKTTLLRAIAGLDPVDSGRILIGGKDMDSVAPQERPVGMAFQYPTLLPQLTVEENIALGPKLRGRARNETALRVRELAREFALEGLLSRKPETLSGGQQQRVSLARALANEPDVLLLDEPLANLDAVSRGELREAIRSSQKRLGVTTVYVTHDQLEAAFLGDRVAIMNGGRLEQAGTAADLYRDPETLFVAQFFGPDRPNLLRGELKNGRFRVEGTSMELEVTLRRNAPAACVIRPRSIRPGGEFAGMVKNIQRTGWSTTIYLECEGVNLRADMEPTTPVEIGRQVTFSVTPSELLFFDSASGARLRE